MSSVDNRIVQMQFENSQFEKGIKQSQKSIEEFEKSLDFENAEKSLNKLQKAGDSFSLAGMAKGIDAISSKFSAMGIIGKRVLEDLTDKAVHMGERFVASVTTDQIAAGWDKYANKTIAVQTIMAATGKDINYVNAQLDKLAWFTDETSYNFVDMTSNIGKFTSMGIDLETSVTAMEGIATWAALSGAGVAEASRAMYNLSQAMGAGSVKMIDWKSIENANMATKEFKQTVIDTAKSMGKLNKEGKTSKGTLVTYENFAQTLQQGWFTSDVLIKSLEQYGVYADEVYKVATEKGITAAEAMKYVSSETMELGEKAFKAAQEAVTFKQAIDSVKDAVSSGWMNIFENIFGNYEEAKVLWTDLANYLWDIFAAPLSSTNELLSEWKKFGGRTDLLKGIYDIFAGIRDIIYTIGDAFNEVFPQTTVDRLLEISAAVKEFGANFRKSFGRYEMDTTVQKGATKLQRLINENTFALGDQGEAVRELQKELVRYGYLAEEAMTGKWNIQSEKALDNYLAGLDAATEKVDKLQNTFKFGDKGEEVEEFQKKLVELGYPIKVDGIYGPETEAAFKKYEAGLDSASKQRRNLRRKDRGEDVKELQRLLNESGLADQIQADGIFGPKTEAALKQYQKAKGLRETGILDEDTMKALYPEYQSSSEEMEQDTISVVSYSESLTKLEKIVRGAAAALDILKKAFGFVGKVAKHLWDLLKPLREAFVTIFAALGDFLFAFNQWLEKSGILDKWFESVKEFFEPFGGWVKTAADSLLEFLGLTGDLDDIDFDKVVENFIQGIKKLFGVKVDPSGVLDGLDTQSIFETIKSKVIEIYEKVRDWVVGLFSGSDEKDGVKSAFHLDGYNIAIAAIAGIIAIISGRLFQAIGTIVDAGRNVNKILKQIKGGLKQLKNMAFFNNMDKAGDALLKFAGAIALLAGAIWLISRLSWSELAVGLTGLVVILGVLVGAVFALSKVTKSFPSIEGVMKALLVLSLSVLAFGITVYMLGQLDWGQIARGLVGVAALLVLAIGSLYFLNKMKINVKEVSGTLGLLGTLALTLGNFANVMAKIGAMDTKQAVQGFIGLALLLAVIGLFLKAMDGIKINWAAVAGILAAAVAIDLIVVGFLAMAFAMKLLTIEDIIKGFVGMLAVVLSIGLLLKAADAVNPNIKSILALLPAALAIDLVIGGFIALLYVLKKATPEEILKAIVGMGFVILAIGGLMALMEAAKPSIGSILALLPAALAIDLVIGGFIALLFTMKKASPMDLVKTVLALGVVVLSLGALFKLMEKTKPSIGSILALLPAALALDLLIGGFIALAFTIRGLTTDQLINSIVALGAIVLLMGAMMKIMEKVKPNIKAILALLPVAIAIDAVIIGFVVLAKAMKKMSFKDILKTIVAFGAIILGLAVVMKALSTINFSIKTIVGLAVLFIGISAVMLVFSLVLNQIKEIDPSVMYAFSISLATALIAFVAACMIVGKIPGGPKAMISGAASIAAAFDVLVILIGALLVGIGALNEVTGGAIETDIESASRVLTALGEALVGFKDSLGLSGEEIVALFAAMMIIGLMPGGGLALIAGSASVAGAFDVLVVLIGGLLTGIGALNEATDGSLETDMNSAASVLTAMADALTGFTSSLGLSGNDIAALFAMMTIIGLMPGGALAVIAGAAAIGGAFDVLVVLIGGLLAGIGALNEATDGGVVEAIEQGGEVLKSIGHAIGSIKTGFMNAESEGLSGFADAVDAIRNSTEGLGSDEEIDADITKALNIAEKIYNFFSDLTSYTINTDGVDGYMTAAAQISTDMGLFGTAIGDFRTGVSGLSSEEEIDADTLKAMYLATALKSFFDGISEQMPSGQGLEDYNAAVESLLDDVALFGTSLGTFHENISGFDTPTIEADTSAAITAATAVADFLVDLKKQSNNIEHNKSALQVFIGGETVQATVLDSIGTLAEKIQEARNKLKGLSGGSFENDFASAMTAVAKIVGILKFMKDNSILSASYFTGDIEEIFNVFIEAADYIVEFRDILSRNNVTDDVTSSVASIISSIATLAEVLSGTGDYAISTKNMLSGIDFDTLNDELSTFSEDFNLAIQNVINDLDVNIESFTSKGMDFANALSTGMSTASITGASDVVTAAIDSIKNDWRQFYSVGKNFAEGLANGMAFRSMVAIMTAKAIAVKMLNIITSTWRVASPSKVTTQYGEYFTEGLANGAEDKIGEATNSVQNVADSMLSTASGTLATLSGLLAEDIDDTPVIAPVVDLSQARESAAMIGGLFGNQSFGVTSNYMANKALVSTNNGRPVTIQNGIMNTSEAMGGVNDQLMALNSYLTTRNDGPKVDEMQVLADKFGDLAEAITNLQIVLDTGVVVGELAPALDVGLGNIATRRDRGN